MKIKLIAALVAALLLGGAILYGRMEVPDVMTDPDAASAPSDAADKFPPLPDVVFKAADGRAFHIGDIREKTVLIHFWAAWCAVCHTEFPDLIEYVENARGTIALLSISLDDDYTDSQKTLDKIAAKYHLALDAPHLYWAWDRDKSLSLGRFDTVKVPETIIVDQNRRMTDKIIGAGPWSEAAGR